MSIWKDICDDFQKAEQFGHMKIPYEIFAKLLVVIEASKPIAYIVSKDLKDAKHQLRLYVALYELGAYDE